MSDPFAWGREEKAEAFLMEILSTAQQQNSWIEQLAFALEQKTSTRLFDWLDAIALPQNHTALTKLEECGFVPFSSSNYGEAFHHPGAQFPKLVKKREGGTVDITVSVDSIGAFLLAHGIDRPIEGSFRSPFRRSLIATEKETELHVVERRGTQTMDPVMANERETYNFLLAKELWQRRNRRKGEAHHLLEEAKKRADEIIALVGKDYAASVILEVERDYWQRRNRAGQMQKNRQDTLGMGWANHDHHTFRSSREFFLPLVRFFETLGFHCRERFYAGEEAGWGAQVMENPQARLILFLDVDLAPEELAIDFAHQPLSPLPSLGTIGLWCALHGDSLLEAGMHHLEAQFLFDRLREDLAKEGIGMMDPFSDFSYLRQAFTKGEQWQVSPERIARLVQTGKLSEEKGRHFLEKGALGSHLENLQRREGYKGFNKKNVSTIIRETDPRKS